MRKLGRFRPRAAASIAAAVLILLFVTFVLLSTVGGSTQVTVGPLDRGHGVSRARFASLALGASREAVEHQLGRGRPAGEPGNNRRGRGRRAFNFEPWDETGPAVEPMDATCVYYGELDSQPPN